MSVNNKKYHHKLSVAGLLICVGIIYGDIGTSPLYVLKAIVGDSPIDKMLIYGGVSCIFWVLTLQTTIKYILITLMADNKGEGGVFSLFFLVRKKSKYFIIPTMIGGCALLADGMITPPISITSAVEGLKINYPDVPVVTIVLIILSVLFLIQRYGTAVVGKGFAPVMVLWFSMLGLLGINQIVDNPFILEAINPYYGVRLLYHHPEGLALLGGVFLCTTGAEALYSDLGHCGKSNIRISWIFVKICLLLNYFGQSAWLIGEKEGTLLESINPFYAIVPPSFLIYATLIATAATIIASQALITGTFTLISEAAKLNLWPKVNIHHPSEKKGQIYVPFANTFLWIGCFLVVLIFRESSKMEAAYGLTITIDMLMTTTLMTAFLKARHYPNYLIIAFAVLFFSIEILFLFGNASKFFHGGWFTVLMGGTFFIIMWTFYRAYNIKKRYVKMVPVSDYTDMIKDLSEDKEVSKYSSHLVYLTNSNFASNLEYKITYSILQKHPKKADIYWLLHVNVVEEPNLKEYTVQKIIDHKMYRVDFNLGFKVAQRINIMFRKVVDDMVKNKEIDIINTYPSLKKHQIPGDFKFIILKKVLSNTYLLNFYDRIVLELFFILDRLSVPVTKGFGLDMASVVTEKIPLITSYKEEEGLVRKEVDHLY